MITLHVEPSIPPCKWREFVETKPKRSIALDGYVSEGPRSHLSGPYANFNHHEGVSRLETRATCAQVLIAVRQGLFNSFRNSKGNPDAHLFVNDCDEDVSLSVFILRNSPLATGCINPRLNRLVSMEDLLDTTAGAYPFPQEMKTLQELMWVFAPYHEFRTDGKLERRNAEAFENIIDSVGERIMAYVVGNGKSIELDTQFETIGGGTGWSMVRETGQNARIGVFTSGIQAFVSVRERGNGRWTYSIGRSSQFIPFPIPKILKALNEAEGSEDDDVWGGSDAAAGSPRICGSQLSPAMVTKIIEDVLKRKRS